MRYRLSHAQPQTHAQLKPSTQFLSFCPGASAPGTLYAMHFRFECVILERWNDGERTTLAPSVQRYSYTIARGFTMGLCDPK